MVVDPFIESSPPPSRHDNPFATCWTRPGARAFRFANGQSAEQLVAKLAAQGWWGAIVGPHGSGKSTLLETLKPALHWGGRHVCSIALRDGQHRLPRGLLPRELEGAILIVDGYEQLSWLERWRLQRHCRRANVGLLVASHGETRLPTLIRLEPDGALVGQLVAELAARVYTSITSADVAASFACHGSNVREVFFELYDRHERSRK
jgi:hypothetical protein